MLSLSLVSIFIYYILIVINMYVLKKIIFDELAKFIESKKNEERERLNKINLFKSLTLKLEKEEVHKEDGVKKILINSLQEVSKNNELIFINKKNISNHENIYTSFLDENYKKTIKITVKNFIERVENE